MSLGANVSIWKKQDDWFWEGNVQAAVSRHLTQKGYSVREIDTASKEQGIDIIATKAAEKILIEVKGWPSNKYMDGPRAGQSKNTNSNTQARHWFSHALLKLMIEGSRHNRARIVLALPEFQTYRRLAEKTHRAFKKLGYEIWFVDQHGQVTVI